MKSWSSNDTPWRCVKEIVLEADIIHVAQIRVNHFLWATTYIEQKYVECNPHRIVISFQ